MSKRAAYAIVHAIQTDVSAVSDRELLRRFTSTNDQRAFAALFKRHAALVLGVCRRGLANDHDAEDACQAVFLVLARKAKSRRWQTSIANWLYATARKTAANARLAAQRRIRREGNGSVPETVQPLDQMTSREFLSALDEELERLPQRYREPLVLCYLEGLTRDEAARRLEIPVNTLKSQLERGRKRLGDALTRRGCGLGIGLLTLAATSTAEAAPLRLVKAVAAAVSGTPSTTVAALAEELAMGMLTKNLLLAGLTTAGILACGLGSAAVAWNALQGEQALTQATAPRETTQQPDKIRTAVDLFGDPLPEGALARFGTVRFRAGTVFVQTAFSPDGKKLASIGRDRHFHTTLTVWDAESGRPLREPLQRRYDPLDVKLESCVWLANGRGFSVAKISTIDYMAWEFTDQDVQPPKAQAPNLMNRSSRGTFLTSAISPKGQFLAGGEQAGVELNEGKLEVWDLVPNAPVRAKEPRWSVETSGKFLHLAFTPDESKLIGITRKQGPAHAPGDGAGWVEPGTPADSVEVFVWDALTGKNLLKFNAADGFVPSPEPGFNSYGFRRSFAVAPDGLTLFTESQDDRLAAYDLVSGKKRFGIDAFITEKGVFKYPIAEMAITDDGRMLLALKHGEVAAFDPKTGSEIWRRRAGEQAGYFTLAIDPDGKRFAIGCGDGRILTCETATGTILKGPSDSSKAVATVAVAKDGRTAYTAGFNGDVLRWDISAGKEISRTHFDLPAPKSNFRTTNFSPDLRTFFGTVSLRKDLNACLFDTATGKLNARLELETYQGSHAAMPPVAWLPDGGVIATNGTDQAFRFDREGRKKQTFLAEGNRETMAVAISPDARILVLAGAPTVPPPQPIPGAQVAIPKMRPTGGWISLFEIASGKPLGTHQWPGEFSRACFTPDGRNVILGSYVFGNGRGGVPGTPKANALVLFDLGTGQLHTPFECPDHVDLQRRIDGVAIAPNGYQLAVLEFGDGSIMDSITLYELASGAIRKQFHGHRNMINDLAFTPDGLKLITVSEDVTGLVWDTAPPKPSGPGTKSDKEKQKQWETLLSLNGHLAYRAMGELAAEPSGTLAFLKTSLKAMPAVTDADLDRLVTRMNSDTLADREAAGNELDVLGSCVAPRIRDRLANVSPLEVRRRLDAYLEKHDQPARITGTRLRERRVVELLEIVGTPEARIFLKQLAESGGSALARDAGAAMMRAGK